MWSTKVGCFDTTLAMCEDRDFTTRARKLGFRLRYEPKARVTHYPAIHGLSDYLGKMRHYGTGTSQYFRRWRDEEPLARLFPASPALRLLMLPALSAAGTAYLVARNLPQYLDALPLSPLLFVGQVWWQWGGYEAMQLERQRMLNRKVVALGRKLIPRFVLDQINPFDRFVINAVREFSAQAPA